jgi:hypothetical protein
MLITFFFNNLKDTYYFQMLVYKQNLSIKFICKQEKRRVYLAAKPSWFNLVDLCKSLTPQMVDLFLFINV